MAAGAQMPSSLMLPSIFQDVCAKGHVQVAEWLFGQAAVSPSVLLDCFARACATGHLAVAQWLWLHTAREVSLDRLAVIAYDACQGGHVHVLHWLNSLGLLVNQETREVIFRCACLHGNLDVAKWVHSLGGVDIHALCNTAFTNAAYALETAHVAQWLFTLDPVRSAWPPWALHLLQTWSAPRDAWMRGVVGVRALP